MYTIEELCPQFAIKLFDNEIGLLGYLVVDRTIGGFATGGVRMVEDITFDEVANLAREMTLKFGFIKRSQGGAKAGIIGGSNLSPKERQKLFLAFGRKLGPILKRKIYVTGEDLGTFYDDIAHIKKGAGLVHTPPKFNQEKPGYYTALSVFIAAESLAKNIGIKLSDCSIAIEGFGKVGESLAELFSEKGTRVVAISTSEGAIYDPHGLDIDKIIKLRKTFGDTLVLNYENEKIIKKEDLLTLDVDLLVPCARPDAINADNVFRLKASMIVPGANIPATVEIEEIMFKRGIQYIPGFVSNCGGVLQFILESLGFSKEEIKRVMLEGLGRKVSEMYDSSIKLGVSLGRVAREIAEENLKIMEATQGIGKSEKVLKYLKNWNKGGIKELLYAVLWKVYILSLKFTSGFLLKPFAIYYTKRELFEGSGYWGHYEP